MKCQQGGCVHRATVFVTNHTLSQVHALCREHGEWRMREWHNAGYVWSWQTHVAEVEASQALRHTGSMTQTVPESGVMSLEELHEEPPLEEQHDALVVQQTEAERELVRLLEENVAMKQLLEREIHAAPGERLLDTTSGVVDDPLPASEAPDPWDLAAEDEPTHPASLDAAYEEQKEYAPVEPISEVQGPTGPSSPAEDVPEPGDGGYKPYTTLSHPRSRNIRSEPRKSTPAAEVPQEPDRELIEAGMSGPVLQFTNKHAYHKLEKCRGSLDDVPTIFVASCGTQSDAWAPADSPAEGSKPCRKCWPDKN